MMIKKEGKELFLEEFEKLGSAPWSPVLRFEDPLDKLKLEKESAKLYKKGKMSLEQLWLGKYFQKEILSSKIPDVEIRWIDPLLGWGVFASRDFRKMEFIAEYTGVVRKRRKGDEKNSYCFEYIITPDFKTSYTIDARDEGGLSRYVNHSFNPNLLSSLATFDHLSHVVLYTKKQVAKGEQLCYDYGPDYWAKRSPPISL